MASRSARELEFIERVGMLFESSGSTRIAGRVVGWLLICDPAEQTQTELVGRLGVSKASISTEIAKLEQLGVVERVARPGDRRTYFAITRDAWPDLMARRLRAIDQFIATADEGLALLVDAAPARRARLVAMQRTHKYFAKAITQALTELRREIEPSTPARSSARRSKRT
ncbi:GbsR/MarR family transcriptional regulator [Nannocystaceae bacterium ST9]